jgi:hypothetical protein
MKTGGIACTLILLPPAGSLVLDLNPASLGSTEGAASDHIIKHIK